MLQPLCIISCKSYNNNMGLPVKLLSENRNGNVYDNMYYKPKSIYYFAFMNGAFTFNITHNDVSQITSINTTIANV